MGNFLASWLTISFSRRTPLRGVNVNLKFPKPVDSWYPQLDQRKQATRKRSDVLAKFWSENLKGRDHVHPASYPMRTEAKRPGREADHSPPSNAEVKNPWNYTSIPPYVYMAWYLIKHKENFTFITFTEIRVSTWKTSRCALSVRPSMWQGKIGAVLTTRSYLSNNRKRRFISWFLLLVFALRLSCSLYGSDRFHDVFLDTWLLY
jgi:hypothetical protein